jgi:hypothetical protein
MRKILILLTFLFCSSVLATISTETTRNDYTGTGATGDFDYTFKIFNKNDIRVVIRDTSTDALTTLTVDTEYTVSGIGESAGGTVTLVDAGGAWMDAEDDLDSGYAISIIRDMDLFQETDIRNQGSFLPETHEDAFDYQMMLIQQLQDEVDRSLKLPETEDPDDWDMTISYPLTASYIIQINSLGDRFETVEFQTLTIEALSPTTTGGDMLYEDGANDIVRLGIGTTSQVLTVSATGIPSWQDRETALAEEGDILIYNDVDTPLGIGGGGQVLTVSVGSGLPSWEDASFSTLMDTDGQMLIYSTGEATLNIGGAGQILTVSGSGLPSWEDQYVSSVSVTGDILIYDETSEAALSIGGANQVLTVSTSGQPSWEDKSTALKTVSNVYGDRNLVIADEVLIVSTDADDGGVPLITLFAAASNSGRTLHIKNISITNVSLAPQEGEFIDGETSQILGEYDGVELISDGENWYAF